MQLENKFKLQYIMGLGEFMCHTTGGNKKGELIFNVWCSSIYGQIPADCWKITLKYKRIKSVLQPKLSGLKLFNMRQIFLFDCLYLLERFDNRKVHDGVEFLKRNICGLLSNISLKQVCNILDEKQTKHKVPLQLIEHRNDNLSFHHQNTKKILVVATMSAGKSTLINALVGARLNKMKTTACTNKLTYIYNKAKEDGIIMLNDEGVLTYDTNIHSHNSDSFIKTALHFNSTLSDLRICLIDTPGSNYSLDQSHRQITNDAIKANDYDAIIFISNSQNFAVNDEMKLLDFVTQNTKKPIIFALNQLDSFNPEDDSIIEIINKFKGILKNKNIKSNIVPLSSKLAMQTKIEETYTSEQDSIELKLLTKRFLNPYYDLPNYIQNTQSATKDMLTKSGITVLEQLISKI